MGEKRYYWLRLKETFFEEDNIRIIEQQPGGEKYLIFYLKLMLKSIKEDGILRHKACIPYTPEILAAITYTDAPTVTEAMELLQQLKMVEVLDDGGLYMSEVEELTGSESDSAERVRRHREKLKPLQCNNDVTTSNETVTAKKELDSDRDLEIEKSVLLLGEKKGALPKRAGKAAVEINPLFQEFWRAYPKKIGKGIAEKAWTKIAPDGTLADKIIEAVKKAMRFDSRFREERYIPHPATWLNGREWLNEYDQTQKGGSDNGNATDRQNDTGFRASSGFRPATGEDES